MNKYIQDFDIKIFSIMVLGVIFAISIPLAEAEIITFEEERTYAGLITDSTDDNDCEDAVSYSISTTGSIYQPVYIKIKSSGTNDCNVGLRQWDVSTIPDNAEIISVEWIASFHQSSGNQYPPLCDIVQVDTRPNTATNAQSLLDEIITNPAFVYNGTFCNSGGYKTINLGASAVDHLQHTSLNNDWFAFAIKARPDLTQQSYHQSSYTDELNNATSLRVVYTTNSSSNIPTNTTKEPPVTNSTTTEPCTYSEPVLFQDCYSSDIGWVQKGLVTIDNESFPGIAKLNNIPGGGGVAEDRAYKQIPTTLPVEGWKAEFEYKFTASSIPSHLPFVLTKGDSELEAQPDSDRIVVTHGGGGLDQLQLGTSGASQPGAIPITVNTQYYVTLERKPTELSLSVFSDPARTIQISNSPFVNSILPTDYADLNFIQHSGDKLGGPARQLTAEIDNTVIVDTSSSQDPPVTNSTATDPSIVEIHTIETDKNTYNYTEIIHVTGQSSLVNRVQITHDYGDNMINAWIGPPVNNSYEYDIDLISLYNGNNLIESGEYIINAIHDQTILNSTTVYINVGEPEIIEPPVTNSTTTDPPVTNSTTTDPPVTNSTTTESITNTNSTFLASAFVDDSYTTIQICHIPPGNTDNPQTISIPDDAWTAHEKHGDTIGECNGNSHKTKKQLEKEIIIEKIKKQKENIQKKSELKSYLNDYNMIKNELKLLKEQGNDANELKNKLLSIISDFQKTFDILKTEFGYDKEYKNEIRVEIKEKNQELSEKMTKSERIFNSKVSSKLTELVFSDDPEKTAKELGLNYKNGHTIITVTLSTINQNILDDLESISQVDGVTDNHVQLTINLKNLKDLGLIPGVEFITPSFSAVQS